MIKFDKKFKILFSMLLILLICIACEKSYAFVSRVDTVSYGIGMFLKIWQWMQYIFPILLTLVLIIINRKKLNFKKIIAFIAIGIIIFGACYFAGDLIFENNKHYSSSSGRMDIIEYNGKTVYVHK